MRIAGTFVCIIASFLMKAQALDSSYWRGWLETPAEAVRIDRWEPNGWWLASGILTGGLTLYHFDEDIRTVVQNARRPASDQISKFAIEPFGDGSYALGATAITWGIGRLSGDEHLQRTSFQALKGWVLAGGAAVVIKQIGHRARPDDFLGSSQWFGPYALTARHSSFLSFHTASAFAVASVFAHSYRDRPWVGIATYSVAGLVGLSRIHDDRHWASDVWFGAALGWYIGRLIVQSDESLQIMPTGNGMSLIWALDH